MPLALIVLIVLLIEFKSSVFPFFTAMAYSSVKKSSSTILSSGLLFTISFAGSSSMIIASIALFLRAKAASITVLKDLTLAPSISSVA